MTYWPFFLNICALFLKRKEDSCFKKSTCRKTIVTWEHFVGEDHKVNLDVCTLINHRNDNKYRLCYRFGSLSVVVTNTGTSSNTITDVTDIRSITGALKVKP